MQDDATGTVALEEQIRTYITDSFLAQARAEALRDDDDLLLLLDSLQILRTVIHLEASFRIKVENSELAVENLGSVAKMAAFVRRKRS